LVSLPRYEVQTDHAGLTASLPSRSFRASADISQVLRTLVTNAC
jgi:hypothetical protein